MKRLKVMPLAFDSFGVRSMATYIEAGRLRVLIDPAVALGPRRYGLPPHRLEQQRMRETWEDVKKHALKSDVLIITHYHYDHHNPDEAEIYKDKIVYIKDPKKYINKSQANRASTFLSKLAGQPQFLEVGDGGEFKHGSASIKFSPPVFHGTNSRLGYVIEVSLSYMGEKVVYTSDVEGPAVKEQVDFIIEENPDLLILDGPMTYMLGYRYSRDSLVRSIANINRIINETSVKTIIVDHHFMRDRNYVERIPEVYDCAARHDVSILSAAKYIGRAEDTLEARRKELYAGG
ncbi:MAG TPA: MBL fold metallo-hydrolase [Methanotrichaceae archaeon]|nr:MBL fold metallo-hydrolase [Methanotrichaceae archaeon]